MELGRMKQDQTKLFCFLREAEPGFIFSQIQKGNTFWVGWLALLHFGEDLRPLDSYRGTACRIRLSATCRTRRLAKMGGGAIILGQERLLRDFSSFFFDFSFLPNRTFPKSKNLG